MTAPWTPSALTDWTSVLHNAAKVPKTSQRYGEAQQVIQDALANIATLNSTANAADVQQAGQLAPGALGSALAGVVGFGRGASLGLVKPPSVEGVGDVIGQAHPTATKVGDAAGTLATGIAASPLVAGLSPAMGGALLSGGMGAARGALDPMLTGDRGIDAALGGLTGIVGGAVIGKVIGKLAPAVTTVGRNIIHLLGRRAAQAGAKVGGDELVATAETTLRNYLGSQNVPAEQIEAAVVRSRPLWQKQVAVPLAASTKPVPVSLEAPSAPVRAATQLERRSGTSMESPTFQRRATDLGQRQRPVPAVEASGVGNPPVNPAGAQAYVDETLKRMTPEGRAAQAAAAPRLASTADKLRAVEAHLGRPLSEQERDIMLERILGKKGSRPGHPVWFGSGSPTE